MTHSNRRRSFGKIFGVLLLSAFVIGIFPGYPQPQVAHASGTIYYFSRSGDDILNDGLSPGSPKKNIGVALGLLQAGNTVLFKRGDAWYDAYLNLTSMSGTAATPIEIGAYGTGPAPVIAGMGILDNAGWVADGTNRWKHAVSGYSDAYRIFVNGVPKAKVGSRNDVDQVYEWAIGGGYVYAYTGSSTVKPVNVEVIRAMGPSSEHPTVEMRDSHYITITGLDIRGSSKYESVLIESPSSHITLDSNTVQRVNGAGIHVRNNGNGDLSTYVSDIAVKNNVVDKVWSQEENDAYNSASPPQHLSGDGVFFEHAADGGLIQGNEIRNFGHSGISLTAHDTNMHGVHNIIVEDNDVSADQSGYMHAIDMNGYEGKTTNNTIRRNFFHDYTSTGHLLGSFNKVYSNIFAGVRRTPVTAHTKQPFGADLWPWDSSGTWMVAHDNWIVNNTFADIDASAIQIGINQYGDGSKVDENVIANNIFYQYSADSTDPTGLTVDASATGDIYVRNNNFWDAKTGASTNKVAVYKHSGALTASQLNSYCPSHCTNNTQSNPMFNDAAGYDFTLTASSPASVISGGVNYISLMGSGFTDFNGNAWDPNGISMGAFQYSP